MNGALLRDAIISASHNVQNNQQDVNALNVFPVPDGDTGTNMSMTISSACKELEKMPDDCTVTQVAKTTSSAMLRGARGNSGVILSLIFRGINKGLKGMTEASPREMVVALSYGVESAYKAVMQPTEGTILTVVRMATKAGAAYGTEHHDAPLADVWQAVIDGAQEALDQTPELLPVLKKAGVVDAGGQGLVHVLRGMQSVFKDGVIIADADAEPAAAVKAEPAEGAALTYSTEFVVKRNQSCDKDPLGMRAFLESIGDDVSVDVTDKKIIAHAMTDAPDRVLAEALKFGELTKITINNVAEEARKAAKKAAKEAAASGETAPAGAAAAAAAEASGPENAPSAAEPPVSVPITKDVGFVAVAAGEGIQQMFLEIGVDVMVSGGQTMNPSTEDILRAVEQTPASTVFVLPNNKNIILAAEQVEDLTSRTVIVIPTRTIPQGIAAMMQYNETDSVEENHLNMKNALDSVGTAQVTFAARDSQMDGLNIKEGQMLGMENGSITVVENDAVTCAHKLVKKLTNRKTSMVTIFWGEGATEEDADKLVKLVSKNKNLEVVAIPGGQPVYSFIISVE